MPDLDAALALIDDANRADQQTLVVDGHQHPKAEIEGRLASEWVARLRDDAPPALLLAARAHHLGRWTVPRNTFHDGRSGYLKWRRHLYVVQGDEAARLVAAAGYDRSTADRVRDLVAKRGLTKDPDRRDHDAQTLEDAICLVFLETQLEEFAIGREDSHVIEIIRKTWAKMSEAGHGEALGLALPARSAALVSQALS